MESLYPVLLSEIGIYLSYEDIASLSLTAKRYRYLESDSDFWRYKTKNEFLELHDYWGQITPFSNYSPRKFYLWLYSQERVTYGSEQFKTVNLCYNRAVLTCNDQLITYFKQKGIKQTERTLKAAIQVNQIDLIEDLKRLLRDISHIYCTKSIKWAAKHGRVELMNRLSEIIKPRMTISDYPDWSPTEYIILGAIAGGQDDILAQYDLSKYPAFLHNIIYLAAKKNRTDLLDRYLIDEYRFCAVNGALVGKNLHLIEKYTLDYESSDLVPMIKSGSRAIFSKFFEQIGYHLIRFPRGQKLIDCLCKNLEYRGQYSFFLSCIYDAVLHGQSEIFEYLLSLPLSTLLEDRQYYTWDYDTYTEYEIKRNHWSILKLYQVDNFYNMLNILEEGHLDVFDYLFTQHCQPYLTTHKFNIGDSNDELLYYVLRWAMKSGAADIVNKYLPLAKSSLVEEVTKDIKREKEFQMNEGATNIVNECVQKN